MSKAKTLANFVLAAVFIIGLQASVLAQSNLAAKTGGIPTQPVSAAVESDRVRDGLAGPVRRVRTETAKLSNVGGRTTEEKRVVLETASYDLKGTKTENQYFPVAGSTLTGKEVYKYDEKGNISEMTVVNENGSLLSKEVYKYDYDSVGNWTKMTTSVAMIEGGNVTFEPTEVTYRSIMYYLDENMLKMAQPASASAPVPAPVPTSTPGNAANAANATSKTAVAEIKAPVPAPSVAKQPVTSKSNSKGGAHKTAPVLPNARAVGDTSGMTNASAGLKLAATVEPTKEPVVVMASEPPPPPRPKPLLKPVSGGALNGRATTLPPPIYPDTAKRAHLSGIVTVDVVVDETGKVISALASSGPAILREAAIQAALKAKFSPTLLSGQPVKVSGQINYKFTLQ